ncbi:MAG: hypothetical protein KAS71_10345 [Bacteroidales bacterium]|nr:hypothetical protein [Bacteroidales bacterium]
MAERRILASNRLIQTEACFEPDEELVAHLNSTILGTPGRIRYKLTSIENKLAHMTELYFVLLRRKDKLLGSIGFHKRITCFGDSNYKSWYIRYFSIHAPFRARRQEKENVRDPERGSSIIRDATSQYMIDPGLLMAENYDKSEKSLVYGYIETLNFRSMNFSEQVGYETIRKLKTLIFTRLKLRPGIKSERIENSRIEDFKIVLKDFYKDHSFFTTDNMFFNGNYFVHLENGEIQAGLQVHPEAWEVLELKGRVNTSLLKILPVLPYIKGIFNPNDFRFLAIEGIYFKEGKEALIELLIESVCAHFKTHFALFWIDSNSELYELLDRSIDFGIIGRSFDRAEANVRVRFNNYSEEEKREFFDNPSYMSAYDSV